jgi:hypothetical protein
VILGREMETADGGWGGRTGGFVAM